MNAMVKEKRAAGRPTLTQNRLKQILKYDPKHGLWKWSDGRGGQAIGSRAGTISNGYRLIFVDYFQWRSSRLIWLFMTGGFPPDGYVVDHINGKRSDDRWCNLRLATPQQNNRNRKPCPRNTSGKVGVCKSTKQGFWNANITIDNRAKSLDHFECKDDAIEARCKAERHYFGDFARRVSDA